MKNDSNSGVTKGLQLNCFQPGYMLFETKFIVIFVLLYDSDWPESRATTICSLLAPLCRPFRLIYSLYYLCPAISRLASAQNTNKQEINHLESLRLSN